MQKMIIGGAALFVLGALAYRYAYKGGDKALATMDFITYPQGALKG